MHPANSAGEFPAFGIGQILARRNLVGLVRLQIQTSLPTFDPTAANSQSAPIQVIQVQDALCRKRAEIHVSQAGCSTLATVFASSQMIGLEFLT